MLASALQNISETIQTGGDAAEKQVEDNHRDQDRRGKSPHGFAGDRNGSGFGQRFHVARRRFRRNRFAVASAISFRNR